MDQEIIVYYPTEWQRGDSPYPHEIILEAMKPYNTTCIITTKDWSDYNAIQQQKKTMRSLSLNDQLIYDEIRTQRTTKQEFAKLRKHYKVLLEEHEEKTYAEKTKKERGGARSKGKSSTSMDFLKQ